MTVLFGQRQKIKSYTSLIIFPVDFSLPQRENRLKSTFLKKKKLNGEGSRLALGRLRPMRRLSQLREGAEAVSGFHLKRNNKQKATQESALTTKSLPSSLLDSLNHQRVDSRSKKNYNLAACGTKTTFTERQTR